LPAMLRAITPQTRVVFVANPNNPTGTLAAPDELRQFVAQIPSHVLLVMDEAYIEFLPEPCDLLPLIRGHQAPQLLLMRTFSKIYGLAGLRLGYGIASVELTSALEKVRQPFNINALVQAGALAALDDAEHIARTRRNNTEGLHLFEHTFRGWNLQFVPSSANFILVHVRDGQRVSAELQKLGVIVRPMAGYGLAEWVRISVGTPMENSRCLNALRKVLDLVA
jgi:histidinol-phosphate aminotransferase